MALLCAYIRSGTPARIKFRTPVLRSSSNISLGSRHTMASHMLASGVPLPAVSARLGHSDMQTTLRVYGHVIHGQDDEAVRRWEEYQRRNRPAGQP